MDGIWVMRVGVSLFDEDENLYEEDIDIVVAADSEDEARELAFNEVCEDHRYADLCDIDEIVVKERPR